jgi:hypothetical protein
MSLKGPKALYYPYCEQKKRGKEGKIMNQTGDIVVDLPGLEEGIKGEIAERIAIFEKEHEPNVSQDGAGWVPRVTRADYVIGAVINIAIIIWLIIALT